MDPALRLQPGQQALTPAQEAEAERFAEASIQAHLSTEPVDEPEAEANLRQAYAVAGLDSPQRIHWLDGPLQLVAVPAPSSMGGSVDASMRDRVRDRVRDSVEASVEASVWKGVWESVRANVEASVGVNVRASVWESLWESVQESAGNSVRASVWESVGAYHDAPWLAFYHFFDVYLASNALHALAQFNELVSGYWLGWKVALLVRRPQVLSRDTQGRLHSATGKCIEYRDGWGFYAWHGVLVPEQVITNPQGLTREDFLGEEHVEVRRVIQERMGSRDVERTGRAGD
jgi:hypothetical protein